MRTDEPAAIMKATKGLKMTPKNTAEIDQALAGLANTWWQLFSNMKREGFTEEQAFRILLTYVNSMTSSAGKGNGKDEEETRP